MGVYKATFYKLDAGVFSTMEDFNELGLSEHLISAIRKKGYVKPTQIQEMAIPILLEGKLDIVAQSQTGTGKTASFALPILELAEPDAGHVQAIILTPTRELALQVSKEFETLGDKKLKVLAIYGGAAITKQIHALKRGVDIVVGTPGRVMDLMQRGNLDLRGIEFFVLDEADEMLDMGFIDDIKKILKQTRDDKRMMLFSATMPKEVLDIAKTITTLKIKLPADGSSITKTMLLTPKHQSIAMLFNENFWQKF